MPSACSPACTTGHARCIDRISSLPLSGMQIRRIDDDLAGPTRSLAVLAATVCLLPCL